MTFYNTVKEYLDRYSVEDIDHLFKAGDLTEDQARQLKDEKHGRELGLLLAEQNKEEYTC